MLKHLNDLFLLVMINLKIRYRQTFIGFIWVLAHPILLFFIQSFLFTFILKNRPDNYSLYLFSGLLPWFYISQTAEMSCQYIQTNFNLFRNLKIHPYKLIWTLAAENYINLFFYSLIIFIYLHLNEGVPFVLFFKYLLSSLWLLFLTAHLSFLASLLNILFKDTRYILHFMFTILYFLTPSFYYVEFLPPRLADLVKLNPFYWVISVFRFEISPNSTALTTLIINIVFGLILTIACFAFWKKMKATIYLKI